jgi:hypothetical protein
MSEVAQRKAQIDRAIGARDATVFAAHLQSWLEATAYLRTLPNFRKLGMDPGAITAFEAADLRDISVRKEADDAVMAFCIAAGLARDKAAFTALDRALTVNYGIIYPGSSALYHCNQKIDPVVTLDDAVGQVLRPLLDGESLTALQVWMGGLRLLQRVRSSNFERELTPLVAAWMTATFASFLETPEAPEAALLDPETNVPKIRASLNRVGTDQAYIATLLLASSGAVELALDPEYLTQLAKLAGRP